MKTAQWLPLPLVLLCTSLMGCRPQLEEPAPKPFRYARLGVTECGPDSDVVKVGFGGRTVRLPCAIAIQSAQPAAQGGYDGIGLGLHYSLERGLGPGVAKVSVGRSSSFLRGSAAAWTNATEILWQQRNGHFRETAWILSAAPDMTMLRVGPLREPALQIVRSVEGGLMRMLLFCWHHTDKVEDIVEMLEADDGESNVPVYCHLQAVVEQRVLMDFTVADGGVVLADVDRFASEFIRYFASIGML